MLRGGGGGEMLSLQALKSSWRKVSAEAEPARVLASLEARWFALLISKGSRNPAARNVPHTRVVGVPTEEELLVAPLAQEIGAHFPRNHTFQDTIEKAPKQIPDGLHMPKHYGVSLDNQSLTRTARTFKILNNNNVVLFDNQVQRQISSRSLKHFRNILLHSATGLLQI